MAKRARGAVPSRSPTLFFLRLPVDLQASSLEWADVYDLITVLDVSRAFRSLIKRYVERTTALRVHPPTARAIRHNSHSSHDVVDKEALDMRRVGGYTAVLSMLARASNLKHIDLRGLAEHCVPTPALHVSLTSLIARNATTLQHVQIPENLEDPHTLYLALAQCPRLAFVDMGHRLCTMESLSCIKLLATQCRQMATVKMEYTPRLPGMMDASRLLPDLPLVDLTCQGALFVATAAAAPPGGLARLESIELLLGDRVLSGAVLSCLSNTLPSLMSMTLRHEDDTHREDDMHRDDGPAMPLAAGTRWVFPKLRILVQSMRAQRAMPVLSTWDTPALEKLHLHRLSLFELNAILSKCPNLVTVRLGKADMRAEPPLSLLPPVGSGRNLCQLDIGEGPLEWIQWLIGSGFDRLQEIRAKRLLFDKTQPLHTTWRQTCVQYLLRTFPLLTRLHLETVAMPSVAVKVDEVKHYASVTHSTAPVMLEHTQLGVLGLRGVPIGQLLHVSCPRLHTFSCVVENADTRMPETGGASARGVLYHFLSRGPNIHLHTLKLRLCHSVADVSLVPLLSVLEPPPDASSLSMPNVTSLSVGGTTAAGLAKLILLCPNVTSLNTSWIEKLPVTGLAHIIKQDRALQLATLAALVPRRVRRLTLPACVFPNTESVVVSIQMIASRLANTLEYLQFPVIPHKGLTETVKRIGGHLKARGASVYVEKALWSAN